MVVVVVVLCARTKHSAFLLTVPCCVSIQLSGKVGTSVE